MELETMVMFGFLGAYLSAYAAQSWRGRVSDLTWIAVITGIYWLAKLVGSVMGEDLLDGDF